MSNTSIVVVVPEFRAYGGEQVLRPEELGAALAAQLPSRKVADLGSKKIIDPQHLKPFDKWRKQMWAIAAKRGLRVMDGYGQNPDLVQEVMAEIRAVAAKAQAQAQFIVGNWDKLVSEWASENPQWASLIRSSAPERAWVRSRFHFGVKAYPLSLEGLKALGITDNGLVQDVEGMGEQLVRELTEASEAMWKDFMTREKIGKNQLVPLVAMSEKAKALGFLDGRARQVAKDLTELLASLPQSGPYEKELPAILKGLRGVIKLGRPTVAKSDSVATKTEQPVQPVEQVPETPVELPQAKPSPVWSFG